MAHAIIPRTDFLNHEIVANIAKSLAKLSSRQHEGSISFQIDIAIAPACKGKKIAQRLLTNDFLIATQPEIKLNYEFSNNRDRTVH